MKAFAVGERKYWSSASKKAFLPSLVRRLVDVHPGAVLAEQRLRHEGRVPAVFHRVLLDDDPVRHAVVGHLERVLVAHVDLVLRGADLVVGVLDVDAHLLQRQHRVATHVGAGVERGQVEVAALVEDLGHAVAGFGRFEVEELELGADVVGVEAHLLGAFEGALQNPARVALVGLAAGHPDVAEHAGDGVLRLGAPGDQVEGRGVRHRDHVRLLDRVEAGDRGPVETHAAVEGVLELGGVDREALQLAEDVGEPEPHETDVVLLDHLDDVSRALRLLCHSASLIRSAKEPHDRRTEPARCEATYYGVDRGSPRSLRVPPEPGITYFK